MTGFRLDPAIAHQTSITPGRGPKYYDLGADDYDLIADGPTGAAPRYMLVLTAGTVVGEDTDGNAFDSTLDLPTGWCPFAMSTTSSTSTAEVLFVW